VDQPPFTTETNTRTHTIMAVLDSCPSFHSSHIIISAQINISCLFALLFGKQSCYVHVIRFSFKLSLNSRTLKN